MNHTPTLSQATAILFAVLLMASPIGGFIQPASAANVTVEHDDFEGDAADSGMPDNWELDYASPDKINVTTTTAAAGDKAVFIDSPSGGATRIRPVDQPFSTGTTKNISVSMLTPSASGGQASPQLHVANSSGISNTEKYIDVEFNGDTLVVNRGGSETTLTSNLCANTWTRITVYNIDPSTDTHAVRWSSPCDSGTVTGIGMNTAMSSGGYNVTKLTVEKDTVGYFDEFVLGAQNNFGGQVVNQDGEATPNATVEIIGANYSSMSGTSAEKFDNFSTDVSTLSNRAPSSYDPNKDLNGDFEDANTSYVAVTTGKVDNRPWVDSADLDDPQLQVPSGEPVVMTVWTPGEPPWPLENEHDQNLPGTLSADATIIVEELSPGGDTISNKTSIEFTKAAGDTILDPSGFHYANETLKPGYYRIYPEDSPESSYVIQVGTHQEIVEALSDEVRTVGGSKTAMAKNVSSRYTENTWYHKTVQANETGHFATYVPPNVEAVAIQTHSATDLQDQGTDLSDLQNVTQNSNSSIYISAQPQVVDVPNNDVRVTTYEFRTAPFAPLSQYQNASAWLSALAQNKSLSELPPALQQALVNASRTDLEQTYENLEQLRTENQRLNDRVDELLEDKEAEIDSDSATDAELRARIQAYEQALAELENTISTGTPSSDVGQDTVSLTFPFDTNLKDSQVAVLVHYSNGTTTSLSPESEYVSVNSKFGGDVVEVTDYPLGNGSAAVANFEVKVANSEGIGQSSERVRNPTFSGEEPILSSVSLSTLHPGPDELVNVSLKPDSPAVFGNLTSLSVWGPDGTKYAGSIGSATSGTIRTNGAGIHTVSATFTNSDGKSFTTTFRVQANEQNVKLPSSVRAVESPVGVYAVVGDAIDAGSVNVKDGGSTTDIVAQIGESDTPPQEVQVYTNGLSLPPESEVNVRVAKGDTQQSLDGQHVSVTVHGKALPEDGIVYRQTAGERSFLGPGQPITRDGSDIGKVTVKDGQTIIETYTDDSGSVTITSDANPNPVERAMYRAEVAIPDVSLP